MSDRLLFEEEIGYGGVAAKSIVFHLKEQIRNGKTTFFYVLIEIKFLTNRFFSTSSLLMTMQYSCIIGAVHHQGQKLTAKTFFYFFFFLNHISHETISHKFCIQFIVDDNAYLMHLILD